MIYNERIKIRLTEPEDLATIAEIRGHPLVAPHQYRASRFMSFEIWLARMLASLAAESFEWKCSTVLFDSSIVGHISEFTTLSKNGAEVQLGWNLHPDYWGRGIMTHALTTHISNLTIDERCNTLTADCFAGNERCLRLLDRLGFKEISVGWLERLIICVFRLCPHRILRHKISPKQWNSKLHENVAQ